jgi:hypothetical protein
VIFTWKQGRTFRQNLEGFCTVNRYSLLLTLSMATALVVPAAGLFAAPGKAPVKVPVKPPVKAPVKAPQQGTEPVAVRTEPPEIITSSRPALLVTIDGPPEYVLVRGAVPLLWRVVNTRVLLLKNAVGRHYLHYCDGFLEAGSLNEPWSVAVKVPGGAKLAEKAARNSKKTNLLEGKPDPRTRKKPSLRKTVIPWVYLSMIPAELIVTDGEPDFISIEGTGLFYARNTTGDLFWRQEDRTMYLLASGFWFRAESYLGPWGLVPDDGLPRDFRAIPDSSVKRGVKASVPPPPKVSSPAQGTVSGSAWLEGLLAGDVSRRVHPGATTAGFAPDPLPQPWCR